MSKLPRIFHNDNFISNNKKTYNTFINVNKVKNNDSLIDSNSLINYFNKSITIVLKSGKEIKGKLISKRKDLILLDNKEYININDIMSIK